MISDDRFIRERRHRLSREHYLGRVSVVFTACVEGRKAVLTSKELVADFVSLLELSARRNRCTVPVYTFMPDHIHVLMLGESECSDTKGAMDAFKFASRWWLYRNRPGVSWQKDYWDHIVRERVGWQASARYIAANPCRAGLCEDMNDWPYTGSIGFELREVLSEAY